MALAWLIYGLQGLDWEMKCYDRRRKGREDKERKPERENRMRL
jgi:hypothetical protein